MSPVNRALRIVLVFAVLSAVAAGCSERNEQSSFDPDAGHPKDWIELHGVAFARNRADCADCHGRRFKGGISKVSCFSEEFKGTGCHPNGPGHPPGFSNPGRHGARAKEEPGDSSGFAYCRICHGKRFAGGLVKVSCFPCHGVNAPHSPSPWTGGEFTHTDTDPGNAPVCALCHRSRPGSPGCFNNTLCHGREGSPHPEGFGDPSVHGPVAMAPPGNRSGFTWCQECHGNNFSGGLSGLSCFPCHGVNAPHSPSPWDAHTSTDPGNAVACAVCHRQPDAPPDLPNGCFNNSLCHGIQRRRL